MEEQTPTTTPQLEQQSTTTEKSQSQAPQQQQQQQQQQQRQQRQKKDRSGNNNNQQQSRKRKAILDLTKYQDKKILISLIGGREIEGILKGFDSLLNLVLDETEEVIRDTEGRLSSNQAIKRKLGLIVIRGPLLLTISPADGFEIIENPFLPGGGSIGEESVF